MATTTKSKPRAATTTTTTTTTKAAPKTAPKKKGKADAARPEANETLLRQWQMLQLVPRQPQKVDVKRLQAALAARGFDVTDRTVQRDLNDLSQVFPLQCDDHSPKGWSWLKAADALQVPGIDAQTALAFRLVEKHLTDALPKATVTQLEPWFANARGVLGAMKEKGVGAWMDRVRVIRRGIHMRPPSVDAAVVEVVYDALLTDRRFLVEYTRRGELAVRKYDVCPLGLVLKDAVAYLVCTLNEHDDPMQLALHRMSSAALTDVPRVVPAGFNLDAYVASGAFNFLIGGTLKLRAAFKKEAAATLQETKLEPYQTELQLPGGEVMIEATVADTRDLRAWLLSYGDAVEVLAPRALREEIGRAARKAASKYDDVVDAPAG